MQSRRRLSELIRSRPVSLVQSQPLTLRTLLPTLPAVHLAFFFFLDAQLAKIEHFYSEKEKEARLRSKKLENQLKKLEDHRRIFDVRTLRRYLT